MIRILGIDPGSRVTGYGIVDQDDLPELFGYWGMCPATGPCPGDLDGSGFVDMSDMAVIIANWGLCP